MLYAIFFNLSGPVVQVPCPSGHTVTGRFYKNSVLMKVKAFYNKKRPSKGWSEVHHLHDTVVTAFFMSTETHAKRFLTVWKRSVSTTLKRSFTVLANQIIVSETFQAFQILTNHISVRKTLSWKPCLVSNVLAFAELANQNPADSIYFTSFFFFFFFFFFFQFRLIIIVIKLIKIIVK